MNEIGIIVLDRTMRATQLILAPSFLRPQQVQVLTFTRSGFPQSGGLPVLLSSPFSFYFLVFALSSSVLVLVYLCSYLNYVNSSLLKKKKELN